MTYAESFSRPPSLTKSEERKLFSKLARAVRKKQSHWVKHHLSAVVKQYLHWAIFLAQSTSWGVVDPEECASAAAEALMSSAVRFNPESGIRFCTYAKHRIRGMTRSLVESEGLERSRTLRLRPPSDRKGENKFDQDYIQIQGVWVGSEELPVSPALAAEDFHEELDKRAMFRDALALVDTLSEPERSMVRDYYLAGLSYRDLGQKYSLSHEMIRRRIGNAISKVKRGSTVHK